jgi:hypothetical protein
MSIFVFIGAAPVLHHVDDVPWQQLLAGGEEGVQLPVALWGRSARQRACTRRGGCWVVRHPPGPRTALAELGVARVCAAHLPQPCDPQKTLFPGGVTERAEGGSTQ